MVVGVGKLNPNFTHWIWSPGFGGLVFRECTRIMDVISEMKESFSEAMKFSSGRFGLFRCRAGSTQSGMGPPLMHSISSWKL